MITKLRSCKEIIAKTVRQLDLTGEDIPWEDMVEYISDALRHIGSYFQYEQKSKVICIKDHRGKLPCDFDQLIQVLGYIKDTITTSEALSDLDTKNISAYNKRIDELEGFLLTETNPTKIDAYKNELANLKVDLKGFVKSLVPVSPFYVGGYEYRDSRILDYNSGLPNLHISDREYKISFDTITTSFCNGEITLLYQALPIDEDGFPLVPDTIMYEEALFWKIASMMALQDKLKNKQLSFDYCDQKWKRYCRGAYADSMMPDLAQMERLKNQFYQLKPQLNLYDQLFVGLGERQVLNRNK